MSRWVPPVATLALLLSLSARAQSTSQPARIATPTPAQVAWQQCEVGMFIHFAPNTFLDREYDDLSLPLDQFNPQRLSTDQWADAAVAMDARYVILVAKHAGGFCLWQTETTDYGVRSTPWRGGKGDVLADLSASCRQRGLKLGVYLSPTDVRHGAGTGGRCETPEQQAAYDRIYRAQLTEVLSRYGRMFEVWFDGSLVVPVGDILEKYAPDAMIFQGPHATIRWVGNEEGVAPYPAWSAVSHAAARSGVATAADGDPHGEVWLPNECDARFRSTWFWRSDNAQTLKSVEQLMDMYEKSVGNGAVLLLNHTPDPSGLIPESDVERGRAFAAAVRRKYGRPLAETRGGGATLELALPAGASVHHVLLAEDFTKGQRVLEYAIEAFGGGGWSQVGGGTAIGAKRIQPVDATGANRLRLRVLRSLGTPHIARFAAFATPRDGP